MLNRLFPARIDNSFNGRRSALWLLGFFVALKLLMSVNSIFNTTTVAEGADGIPLQTFGPAAAGAVLMLFALMSLGQLALAAIALTVLIRYRALVPFIYLVLLAEQIARRFIVLSYSFPRTDGASAGWYVTVAMLVLLGLGLLLSLLPRIPRAAT